MDEQSLIKAKLKELLPRDRYEHSLRVERSALALAKHYRVPVSKASTAALLHDCSRFLSPGQMLAKAIALGLKVGRTEKFQPKLLHARLSAIFARKLFKVTDRQVLTAIERHTVGAEKMSCLDQIIYLADHIEEERDYQGVHEVRKLAYRDINAAVAASTSHMIAALLKKGLPVFEETVKTRNAHLLRTFKY
jgi:predicted HD superfamily hydrolase involved in NAD metabolism